MAKFSMFVYALINFLSLFLVETAITNIRCVSDDDCPKVIKPLVMKCIGNYCYFFMIYEGP
ncbi:putative Late nodulin [Medicago truncatula]|uniref:Nodule Cysteine-Rich (NCR) secreted peptide n=1 Tax=Medicago truncatula TaxID=3880 RepID=A7KH99_MEDTR|nr:nodule-specific cysteine-rich peptide 138 [Medicago truncatula]AES98045.1 Nodule Cysteine-Rich (NCR) secreted peptide [Medicago truncatula]RHN56112.1 putative Late nodulin [Medicago truncatula]